MAKSEKGFPSDRTYAALRGWAGRNGYLTRVKEGGEAVALVDKDGNLVAYYRKKGETYHVEREEKPAVKGTRIPRAREVTRKQKSKGKPAPKRGKKSPAKPKKKKGKKRRAVSATPHRKGVATPPAGFEPLRPSAELAAAARHAIEERLDDASSVIKSMSTQVKVHSYADGSIDGELAISPVPRGESVRSVLLDLEEAFGKSSLGKGFWISIGLRYYTREGEEIYKRHKGMSDVSAYWQRATPSKIGMNFATAREEIQENLARKKRRKAEVIYLRLHWNPADEKPKR